MSLRLKDLPPAMRKAALAATAEPATVPVRRPRQKRPAELLMVCHQCQGEGVPYAQLEAHLHAEGHVRADCVLS